MSGELYLKANADGAYEIAIPVFLTKGEWLEVQNRISPDLMIRDDEDAPSYFARTGLSPRDPVLAIIEAAQGEYGEDTAETS